MQDGIVKRLLDDTCPPVGGYRALRLQEPAAATANAWLWGESSPFSRPGRLCQQNSRTKTSRIIVDSLTRYPLMHLQRGGARLGAAILRSSRPATASSRRNAILEPEFPAHDPRPAARLSGGAPAARLIRFMTLNLSMCRWGCCRCWDCCCCSSMPLLRRALGRGQPAGPGAAGR